MSYFSEESNAIIDKPPNEFGVYKKPFQYVFIHFSVGFFSFYYLWIGVLFIIYQLAQFCLNKRFFFFQGRIEEGNSFLHTFSKLFEFFCGVLVAWIVHLVFPKFKLPKDRF